MIDFKVAWDKLAGFHDADEIAQFLTDQGIKATLNNPKSCAISKWMQEVTGDINIRTYIGYTHNQELASDPIIHTVPISDFIYKFDNEYYPDLIQEEEE